MWVCSPPRPAEAPATTDGANLKLQGQSLALTQVASSGWLNEAAARRGKGMFTRLRMDGCVVDLPLVFSTLVDRRPADGLALRSTINLYTITMHIKKVPRTPS